MWSILQVPSIFSQSYYNSDPNPCGEQVFAVIAADKILADSKIFSRILTLLWESNYIIGDIFSVSKA